MTNLLIIPSIDIKEGKTIRVVQGIPELNCSEYDDDPVEMAMIWRIENAKALHLVDFDSSQKHSHNNFEIIKKICDSVIIPVSFGGGIKSYEDADEIFNLGVFRIVIGTLMFENEKEFKKILSKFGPKSVIAAIDVVENEVVVGARKINTGLSPIEYAKKLVDMGIQRLVVTDVKRNGMLAGPNIELSVQIAQTTGVKITHSGGISKYADLIKIKEKMEFGIDSVIIGRALYENKFPCQKIWRMAESKIF